MGSRAYPRPVYGDTYLDRLKKYTPIEPIAAWIFLNATITGAGEDVPKATIQWVAFFVCTLLTIIYTWQATSSRVRPISVTEIILTTIAFVVWVFALGGPFLQLSWYNPLYGALALMLYSLMAPLIVPADRYPHGFESWEGESSRGSR